MKTIILILCLCVIQGLAVFEWQFVAPGGQAIIINVTVGTPSVQVRVHLDFDQFNAGLELSSSVSIGGLYNYSASSTFNETGPALNEANQTVGIMGTDIVVIKSPNGDQHSFKESIIQIDYLSWEVSRLNLVPSYRGSRTFIDQILELEPEPIVVWNYHNLPSQSNEHYSGALTFGGRPKICSDKWAKVNVIKARYFIWSFNLSSITVGKYRQSGSQALFSFDSSTKIEYPLDAYKLVLKALGGSFGTSQIDCNVKQEIVYNINGMDLHLKPDDYLDRSKQNTSGECRFLGKFGFTYVLPASILSKTCVLFDFKNNQMGFSRHLN